MIELYTARYRALEGPGMEGMVPMRVGPPPIIPVSYPLEEMEVAKTLVPNGETLATGGGEWRPMSRAYWSQLDAAGLERITEELNGISARHGGKPLVLVSEDNLEKGHRDLRVVAAAWLEECTGRPVYELTGDGRRLHYKELPKRVRPKRPRRHDRRWSTDEYIASWPLTDDDLRKWVASRHWQFARTTPHNPHQYSHRGWGDEGMFNRVVQHIREHGYQQKYANDVYTVYDLDGMFYWSMGDPAAVTVILNRKYHDAEKQARLAEEQTGKSREELGLAKQKTQAKTAEETRAAEPGLFGLFDNEGS